MCSNSGSVFPPAGETLKSESCQLDGSAITTKSEHLLFGYFNIWAFCTSGSCLTALERTGSEPDQTCSGTAHILILTVELSFS